MSESRDKNGMEEKDAVHPTFSTMAEVEATNLFEGENVNWKYCKEHATFSHYEACEFIIHSGDKEFVANRAAEMLKYGCTQDFITAYVVAAASGAIRVLFWA